MNVVGHVPDTTMGAGAVRRLGKLCARRFGARRAFLITDKGLTRAGLTRLCAKILEDAGVACTVFDDVFPNPSAQLVEEGARRLRALLDGGGSTVVVTLGGGSSMDAGKAITMLAAQPGGEHSILPFTRIPQLKQDGSAIDYSTLRPSKRPDARRVPPIVAIPTTSGTASETNGEAVITDTSDGPRRHRKLIYGNDCSKASMILLDPELTVGVPRYPTATCAMDVLTHALEAYTSQGANEYGEAVAFAAIKLIAEYLPRLMNDLSDLKCRAKIQLASHMAGVAFNINSLGIIHAMGHPLSAMYNQAHGQTLATLMPVLMRFNMGKEENGCTAKYAEVAKAFGVHNPSLSTRENAEAAVCAIAELSQRVGTAKSIEMLGGKREDIPTLVDQALADICILQTIRTPTRDEVAELYAAAFRDDELYPPPARNISRL